jgi:hypothetical protein
MAIINEEAEMIYHTPAQPYFRARANSPFLQELDRQKVFSLSVDRKLWLALGKMLLVLCPICLAVNLWLGSCCTLLERSTQAVDNSRHQLMERQISLSAERSYLLSPERVQFIAAKKLSLYVPEKGQVKLL